MALLAARACAWQTNKRAVWPLRVALTQPPSPAAVCCRCFLCQAWYKAPTDIKNSIQLELECCGLTYWNDSAVWPCPASANFSGGDFCYPQLVSAFERAWQHAGGTGIAFSVLMGAGIFFVACLIQGIKRRKHAQDLDMIRDAHAGAGGAPAGEGVDVGSIDAGAASMFDKADEQGYIPAGGVKGRR